MSADRHGILVAADFNPPKTENKFLSSVGTEYFIRN